MNPKMFKSGEIYDDGSGYTFSLHFIENVTDLGVGIELLYQPSTYPETPRRKAYIFYHKLAAHGCFIPFNSSFWLEYRNQNWKKVGFLSGLIGQKSLKIEI